MTDLEQLESDYSDEEDTFNEDFFITFYLDDLFYLYYNLRDTIYFNPSIMSKSNVSSFTTLVIDAIFNQKDIVKKYQKGFSYRENRFFEDNKRDIDIIVDSIWDFINFINLKYNAFNTVSKDILYKWVVRSSHLSYL